MIARLFGVTYTLRGVSYLLHRLGFSAQVAARRAASGTRTASQPGAARWAKADCLAAAGVDLLRGRIRAGTVAAEGPQLGPPRAHTGGPGLRPWNRADLGRRRLVGDEEQHGQPDPRDHRSARGRDAAPVGPRPAATRSHHRIPRPDPAYPRTRTALTSRPRHFKLCSAVAGTFAWLLSHGDSTADAVQPASLTASHTGNILVGPWAEFGGARWRRENPCPPLHLATGLEPTRTPAIR